MRHNEPYDLSQFDDMSPRDIARKVRKDLEFAMPRPGMTSMTASIGGQRYERRIWHCPEPGCYWVCVMRADQTEEQVTREHAACTFGEQQCPSLPRREALSSGLAEIEKLWREMDDVIDAIKSTVQYRGMDGDQLLAYAKGLAFSIIMKEGITYFPDMKAVSKEALDRWRMRNGKMAFRQTPSQQGDKWTGMSPGGGWIPVGDSPATSAPPVKRTPRKTAQPAMAPDKVAGIKAAVNAGMFSYADIASMFGVTQSQVSSVAESSA